MSIMKIGLATGILLNLLVIWGCQSAGHQSAEKPDTSGGQTQRLHRDDSTLPNGVIGMSISIGAERVGEPASLYVSRVHPDGPARQAGIKHGDDVVMVNGVPVMGKTYDEVIQMVRGQAGSEVKLGVRSGEEVREISITRVASEMLHK
jgi:C-terminal processing protease CtpA/Prc